MPASPHHRPGDKIIDRYLPGANAEQRELARTRLQAYSRWLLEVAMEQARAKAQDSDSRDEDTSVTMDSALPPSP